MPPELSTELTNIMHRNQKRKREKRIKNRKKKYKKKIGNHVSKVDKLTSRLVVMPANGLPSKGLKYENGKLKN